MELPSVPGEPASPRRLLDAVLAALAGAYVFVATFPDMTYMPAGLDGSWRIEVNRLFVEHLFGRDAVFTYGPLGCLLVPTDVPSAVVGASLLRFAQQAAVALTVAWLAMRRRGLIALAVAGAWIAATGWGLMFEHALVVLTPLLALESVRTGRRRWLILAFSLAGAAMMVKTSLAVTALGVCVTAGALLLRRDGLQALRALAPAVAAYVAAVAMLGAFLLHSPREILEWLRLALQTADGYNVAMSVDGPPDHLLAATAILALAMVLAVWLLWRGTAAGQVALAFAVPVFIAFKHSFVRHDGPHEMAFLPLLVAALSIVLVRAEKRVEIVATAAVLIVAATGAGLLANSAGSASHPGLREVAKAARGLRNLRMWADIPGEIRRQRTFVDVAISGDKVPGLRERVAGETVGIIPWELAYCRANGLRCIPNPTLQLYAAYTAEFDLLTAAHYLRPSAPEFVVIDDQAIDGRRVVLDTPATIRALQANYEITPAQLGTDRLLLRKRRVPLPEEARVIGRAVARPGRWVAVPESRGLVFARADFDLSLRGRLQKAFFKVSRVTLDVVYCDGRTASYRVVPDTARNGLLLNGLADEEGGLARILERRPGDPVTLIRFSGPGLVAHRQPIPVTWAEVRGAADRTSVCVHTSGPALADLQRRKIPGGKPLMAIDDFEPETEEGHGGILRVRGWAVDPVAERPAAGLLVEVAGHVSWLPVGRKRPDVAAVFGVPAYSSSGYVGLVSLVGVPPGRHEVVFRVVTADGRGYYYDDRLRREVQVR